jgi:hypothetical protein
METVTEGADEYQRVLPGFSIVTIDCVADPSVTEAVMHLMEGRNRLLTRSMRIKKNPEASLLEELNKWLKGKNI